MAIRKLRFSLRLLLLLVAVIAIVLATIGHRAARQNQVLSAINSIGGEYDFEPKDVGPLGTWLGKIYGEEAFGKVLSVDLRKTDANDKLLSKIACLRDLENLDLSSVNVSDRGVESIAHLPLHELWLQGTKVTDEVGTHLAKCHTLEMLAINATDVGDAFLVNLGHHPGLQDLGLRGTKVTAEGTKALANFPKLRKIRLYDNPIDDSAVKHIAANCPDVTLLGLCMTQISDQSLAHLATMSKLESVDISGNKPITKEAVLKLEVTLTNCRVEWYGDR